MNLSQQRAARAGVTPGSRRRVLVKESVGGEGIPPIPPKPPEMSWRDYLIMLLHLGAELEHALMVQYLFAAYSLGSDDAGQADIDRINHWRETLLTIAKEEMGHLLTVQNVLCFVGGEVNLNRTDFPWDSPFQPFPFELAPVSLDTLVQYVFAEMPENAARLQAFEEHHRKGGNSAEAAGLNEDTELMRHLCRRMGAWVQEGKARPVGEVYHEIIAILGDPEKIPNEALRGDTFDHQASWDDWGRGHRPPPARPQETRPPKGSRRSSVLICQMATRTEALEALRQLAAQGEASHLKSSAGDEPSHYERFVGVYEDFARFLAEKAGQVRPVRRVASNPTTVTDPLYVPAGANPIRHPGSRRWAHLFNLRYRLLLTYLSHTFRLARLVPPDEPNTRGAVMHKVFGEMYNLRAIAGLLVRQPLGDPEHPDWRAGPPFEMPYSLALPLDELDRWRLYQDILGSSVRLIDEMLDPGSHLLDDTPPEGREYLNSLRALDLQSLEWAGQVAAGLLARRRAEL